MSKRKTLVERVKWSDTTAHGFQVARGRLGDIWFEVVGKSSDGEYRVGCVLLPSERAYITAADWDAAKAEALRLVQRAVLEAAEAWRD